MRIYVDTTEPGLIVQDLTRRARVYGIEVERSILHKREGIGASMRAEHPLYGLGADFVIVDDHRVPVAAVERKTLEDLERSAMIRDPKTSAGNKLFRQLRELRTHPFPVLLLEGEPSPAYRRHEPALLGLQLWCARQARKILFQPPTHDGTIALP